MEVRQNIYTDIGYYLSTGEASTQFIHKLIDELHKRDVQIIKLNEKVNSIGSQITEMMEVIKNG